MATVVVARTKATSGVSDCADEWPHASLRGLTILLGALAVVSIGGLIATVVVSMVGEKYAECGEVSIPGSAAIALPAR